MSNLFVNLPLPVLNGPGAAVDTSGMGALKTLSCVGNFDPATVLIEASVDGGVTWGPVKLFHSGDSEVNVSVTANFMRTNVSGRNTIVPFSANLEVAAPAAAGLFADIPIPSTIGPGVAVDISAFGVESTFISGGDFAGASIRVEISDDNINFAPLMTFAGQGGLKTTQVTARWVRANISGHPISATLAIGSAPDPLIVDGINVQIDGTPLPGGPFDTINFDPDIEVVDEGGGVLGLSVVTPPNSAITFRPNDPAGNHDDTYVVWQDAYDAARNLAKESVVTLSFDFQFMQQIVVTPAGTNVRMFKLPAGRWDMRSIKWSNYNPFDAIGFEEGCFVENIEVIGGSQLTLINDTLYTTPIIFGGISPFGFARQGISFGETRVDMVNNVIGCKPLFKQGSAGSFLSFHGPSVFTTLGSKQLLGNFTLPSPLVDMAGQNYTHACPSFEDNCFTSLAASFATGATATLSAPASPGDMAITVVSLPVGALAFPPSGTVNINNQNYSETLTYSSIVGTTFNLTAPVVGGYAGPTGTQLGSSVIVPTAVAAGGGTLLAPGTGIINVNSVAGFPAVGALRVNGNLEVITYTGTSGGNSFTGCLKSSGAAITGGYPIGTMLEPIRAVAWQQGVGDSLAFAAGTVTLTDSAGKFTAAMVGEPIFIRGAVAAGNNVVSVVASFISATQITFANATGVTDTNYNGSWGIGALPIGTMTIPVDSTDGFPTTFPFNVFVYQNGVSETVACSAKTATSFTVAPLTKAYGVGAIVELASSFRGGVFSNHILATAHATGRYGTQMWQQPGLDSPATVTLAPSAWPLSAFGTSSRIRRIIRTSAPITPVATVSTAGVGVGAVTIPAVTAGFPATGFLVIGDGSESVAYSGLVGGFSGCTPLAKAHLVGVNIKYGASFSEVVMLNATGAVAVQLPTARRSFGEIVTVKEASGGAAGITVHAFTGETIDGAATSVIAGAFGSRSFVSNGLGGWLVM